MGNACPSFFAVCEQLYFVGDGKCHDFTNNLYCAFDGGDCCKDQVNYEECQICACIDPSKSVGTSPLQGIRGRK